MDIYKRFMDYLGYEFRTPITVAVELTFLLSNGQNEKKIVSVIKENNVKLTRTLVNTLDYLKLLTGSITFKQEICYLDALFDIIKKKIQKKNSTIYYSIEENIKLVVDRQRFMEMVIHIITYFTERNDKAIINVKSRTKDDLLNIYFTDNGKILNEIQNIFQGFCEKDYIQNHSQLEIPISKGLALGMGGDLILENTTDYGSTFKFSLKI